ncbi:hypothetical protein Asppvi_000854 [Aspergillus pseudoviridinutans]|uniref:Epoxide hydrolase N-terminal domain-containing protein n=1 Tax=Aspergillus pseudoviridinutans TaxID=1517512 RepID=A0A9P3B1E7_9EURO|nr:uncharacterized protein Asppvi_000854 [Aspergillus pseudoviridinutans]GIJ82347.1 hypothetical protein Asppvi_000854 [Aspergillus pseudoviridinutans]
MNRIRPFNIRIPDSQLDLLNQKLQSASFPDELDAAGWDLGVPLDEIKRLTAYWRDGFDWRAKEKELNEKLQQFMVSVSVPGFAELDIHYVHQKSPTPGAIPLLFLHGWPGSFLEAVKLIPLLTKGDENQPAFDLVVPSLPNFGFSQGVKQRGFGLAQYAQAMHALMLNLGYEEYVIQGGDWGSIIARVMATLYPQHVKAVHLNFAPVAPPYPWRHPWIFLQSVLTLPFSPKSRALISTTLDYLNRGNAYMRQQETRPQTLGYGLHDSPVALLAWIYDKLHAWADDYPWTDDEILTWVSVYQFSVAGPAASVRIYYEAAQTPPADAPASTLKRVSTVDAISGSIPGEVKLAVAHFKRELVKLPFLWCRSMGSVVRVSEFECGGHFAAWEVPELLAADVRSFLGKYGQACGAVTGKNGY